MKKCSKCGETKSASEFSKDASNKDGLCGWCKTCRADYRAIRHAEFTQYRQDRRAEKAQYDVQYQHDHCAEIAQYQAQYRQAHRANRVQYDVQYRYKHRAKKAQYRQDHHADITQRHATWRHANPDKVRANRHRRRARKLSVGGTHTAADIQRQGECQKWKYWWCGKDCKDKYHVDHLIPLAKGGHNNPSNIVIACLHCNCAKKDKLPDEFANRLL